MDCSLSRMDQNEDLLPPKKHVAAHYSGWYSPENAAAQLIGFAGLLLFNCYSSSLLLQCTWQIPVGQFRENPACTPGWQTWELIQSLIVSVKQQLRWSLGVLVWFWSCNQAVYLEMFHMGSCTSLVDAQKIYVVLEKWQALPDFTQCLVLFGSQRNWANKHTIAACQHMASSVGSQTYF